MKKIEDLNALKIASYDYCGQYVADRLARIQAQIRELESALSSETKSSAGDKHETGRAMIQLEREKLGQQLAELEKIQHLFSKIPKNNSSLSVRLGSLVVTDSLIYYISISAGEFKSKSKSVYCISASTPIGKLIFSKVVGDSFSFNSKVIRILSIF